MGAVILDMAISLDGLVAGPGGADGGLYDWFGEPSDVSRRVVEELLESAGALLMGRGAYDAGVESAGGWDDSPYPVPHVVLTHRPPDPLPTSKVEFVFVTEGVRDAVAAAQALAGDRAVALGGGPDIARQCLDEQLVDEVQLHVAPVLLGDGIPLFARPGPRRSLTLTRVLDAPGVTHLRYSVDRSVDASADGAQPG